MTNRARSKGKERFFLFIVVPLILTVMSFQWQPQVETRANTWITVGFGREGQVQGLAVEPERQDALVLPPGALSGSYLSPVKKADFPFNAVGARWAGELPQGTTMKLQLRSSVDGREWTDWMTFEEVDQFHAVGAPVADLIITQGNYLQYWVTLSRERTDLSPHLWEVTLTYIDSSRGPTVEEARLAARAMAAVGGVPAPSIIPRSGWGANEEYRFMDSGEIWPPSYEPSLKAIVHHTATSNTDPDPAMTVRAIYYYHAVSLGWGDMGYNFLVDRFGNIYEGRYGGQDVVGGHALEYNQGSVGVAAMGHFSTSGVAEPLENGLVSLLAWKAYSRGFNPEASGFFVDKALPNIMGHKDTMSTSCPGSNLYARLPAIRTRVWTKLPDYGQVFYQHTTPPAVLADKPLEVSITLRNSGRLTWTKGGTRSFRIGYLWYDNTGRPYQQQSSLELHTDLPQEVKPGEQVTVPARLLVPSTPGNYTLRWDMVHEGVTWFSQVPMGNPTLDVKVVVSMTLYYVGWLGHNTPTKLAPGQTVIVNLKLENKGVRTWENQGKYAFRLGYRWYDSQGKQYLQPAPEDHRTSLPSNIQYGQSVELKAQLTASREPGAYVLKWDMVHEGYTWFTDQSSPTLDVAVLVEPPPLEVSPTAVAFVSSASVLSKRVSVQSPHPEVTTWRVVFTPIPWLQVEPTSGTLPGTFDLTALPKDLPSGMYYQEVSVEGILAGSPVVTKTIGVTLAVEGQLYKLYMPYIARDNAGDW